MMINPKLNTIFTIARVEPRIRIVIFKIHPEENVVYPFLARTHAQSVDINIWVVDINRTDDKGFVLRVKTIIDTFFS